MIQSGLTPVAAEPTIATRVFLRERDGLERWLHMAGTLLTENKAYRWTGTPAQAIAIKRKNAIARDLIAIRVPQPEPTSEAYK